jgi:hypothetical protein
MAGISLLEHISARLIIHSTNMPDFGHIEIVWLYGRELLLGAHFGSVKIPFHQCS